MGSRLMVVRVSGIQRITTLGKSELYLCGPQQGRMTGYINTNSQSASYSRRIGCFVSLLIPRTSVHLGPSVSTTSHPLIGSELSTFLMR